jgi:soluble lytic murein transglycosylase-like protein
MLGIPGLEASAMRAHVRSFIERHPGHFLTETIQRDLLSSLVSRDLWDDTQRLVSEMPPSIDSPGLACARVKFGLPSVATGSSPSRDRPGNQQIAVGQETSSICLKLVERLAREGQAELNYVRQRARWAAQSGNESGHARLIELMRSQPQWHDSGLRGRDPLGSEERLGQILQTTRISGLNSLQRLQDHEKSLTPEQLRYAQLAVGAALWTRTHGESWPLMLKGWPSLADQPAAVQMTVARETIRRSDWSRLLQVLDSLPTAEQNDITWQYWRAIALRETQNPATARKILLQISNETSFYGLLARETLHGSVQIASRPARALSSEEMARLDQDPGIQRSYALLRAGLRPEAIQEWSAAMRGRNDAELLQAALHAQSLGFIDRTIAAADRTQKEHDFRLRFPTPFKDLVVPEAQQQAIDPWWVLGLIRQESRFIPDIRSSVGATGLMQIMPATGKMLAKQVGMKNTSKLQLNDIKTNLRLGTTYMRQLHDRFGGSALLASAAYNAGPSRAVIWRAALPQRIDGAAFAESIPFSETRDYVKRVLTNAVLYHAVHHEGRVPSLRTLLGEVLPNEAS